MDLYQEKLASDGFKALHSVRLKHTHINSAEDLRDGMTDFEQISVGKEIGLLTKSRMKTLHGLLSQRNECAHPGGIEPTMNETLGFISKLFGYITHIRGFPL